MSDALYHERILAHDRAPHHHGALPGATHEATIDNPLCGDTVTVRVIVEGDEIRAIAFEARGCALSRAAASMMTDRVLGAALADARSLGERFAAFVAEPLDAPVAEELGELDAFRGVRGVRSRRTCATLPWRALAAAIR